MAQISNISLTPYGSLKNEQEVRDARRAELYSFAANYLAHFIENLSKEKQFVYLNLTNKTFCMVNRKTVNTSPTTVIPAHLVEYFNHNEVIYNPGIILLDEREALVSVVPNPYRLNKPISLEKKKEEVIDSISLTSSVLDTERVWSTESYISVPLVSEAHKNAYVVPVEVFRVLWPIGNIGSISKNDAFVSRLSDFQSRMMAGRKDNDVLGEVEHYAVTMLAQYLYNRTELIKG